MESVGLKEKAAGEGGTAECKTQRVCERVSH